MLRLQLLPDQVFEGARIKKAVLLCTALFLVDAVICFLWFSSTKTAMLSMTQQAEVASGFKSQIDALDGQIAGLQAQIAPVDSKRDYILALKDYGDNWPQRMRELAKYIYARVEVLSCQLDTQGFELEVRTKTTEDVARLLMNLKMAYAAGLLQQDSLNVTGVTGWPNMTSPWGYSLDEILHMEIGVDRDSFDLEAVNSNSNPAAPAGGGGGSSGAEAGSGAEAMPEESSSSDMSGEPGMEGSGGGGGTRAGNVESDRMRLMALQKYIEPSVDPPPQPYMNLTITGRWQVPLAEPTGNTPAGGAAAPNAGATAMDSSGMDVQPEAPVESSPAE